MGKTRAKRAQLQRARQSMQVVATISFPGPVTGPAGSEGGPWPTGTRVQPRTYAMAAGGRPGWLHQGPCHVTGGSRPCPTGGADQDGFRFAPTNCQAAPRGTTQEPQWTAVRKGSRHPPGKGGAQQGPYQAGAQQGDRCATAATGGRAAGNQGGVPQGHRWAPAARSGRITKLCATAATGGCARPVGGTQQGNRRAATHQGGSTDGDKGGTRSGNGDERRADGRRGRTLRPSQPTLQGGRTEGTERTDGHPAGGKATSTATASTNGNRHRSRSDTATAGSPEPPDEASLRAAPTADTISHVFSQHRGDEEEIPPALIKATDNLLKTMEEVENQRKPANYQGWKKTVGAALQGAQPGTTHLHQGPRRPRSCPEAATVGPRV